MPLGKINNKYGVERLLHAGCMEASGEDGACRWPGVHQEGALGWGRPETGTGHHRSMPAARSPALLFSKMGLWNRYSKEGGQGRKRSRARRSLGSAAGGPHRPGRLRGRKAPRAEADSGGGGSGHVLLLHRNWNDTKQAEEPRPRHRAI